MASFGDGLPATQDMFNGLGSNNGFGNDDGGDGTNPIDLLSQGIPQTVRICSRLMLEKTMESLGAQHAPVFSAMPVPDLGVKFSIKLDVSSLTSVNGERIMIYVVEGDTFMDAKSAQYSAVMKAFSFLENNYRVQIVDFSSRVARSLESSNTYEFFIQGNACLQKLLEQWDLALGKFQNFSGIIERKQCPDKFYGPQTGGLKVYGLLSEYLTTLHSALHDKYKDLRLGMEDIELDRRHHIRKLAKKQRKFIRMGPFDEVHFSSKDTLDYVLCFYGLTPPEYSSTPKPESMVESTVVFYFPYIEGFKYYGNIRIPTLSYTTSLAEEEAAHRALLFIEKNFMTKVADYSYIEREKALKAEKRLMSMLSNVLQTADAIKMMFGEMISGLEGKLQRFSLNPSGFFVGDMAASQIDAYDLCYNGLKELAQYVANCYASSAAEFSVLDKLSWDLNAAEQKLEID